LSEQFKFHQNVTTQKSDVYSRAVLKEIRVWKYQGLTLPFDSNSLILPVAEK